MADTSSTSAILGRRGAPVRRLQGRRGHFPEGDPAKELFIVKSGKVDIRLGNRLLDTLPELSIFGEMALIDPAPRSATAVAATDATLVPVAKSNFFFWSAARRYFALNVMRVLVQRLRYIQYRGLLAR